MPSSLDPDFGIEGLYRRFKQGQPIELPDTLTCHQGFLWQVRWVEVLTFEDRDTGDRVFKVAYVSWWKRA